MSLRKDLLALIAFLLMVLLLFVCFRIAIGQDIELENLIFNQTATHIGGRFYEEFTARWEWPSGYDGLNIFISEVISGQYGNQIKIEVGGLVEKTTVYRRALKPKIETIEKEVGLGIGAVRNFLISHGSLELNETF